MLKNNVYLKHKLSRHRPLRTLKASQEPLLEFGGGDGVTTNLTVH